MAESYQTNRQSGSAQWAVLVAAALSGCVTAEIDETSHGPGTDAPTSTDTQTDDLDAGGEDDPCDACEAVGANLEAMACAFELCSGETLLGQEYLSPSGASVASTFVAMERFGDEGNDLAPKGHGSYALMATGPAEGTAHSSSMGGFALEDEWDPDAAGTTIQDVFEWRLELRAPEGAKGFRFKYVFMSEEYDDFIGTLFNDKLYVFLEGPETTGGARRQIAFTQCRNPDDYYDFVCAAEEEGCVPGEHYCYIAVNTALSECCWYDGCDTAGENTDISGTGFECAVSSTSDNKDHGSSTGWIETRWPIEGGEAFELVIHIHDTGDGVLDSEVVLDEFEFLDEEPDAGTVVIE